MVIINIAGNYKAPKEKVIITDCYYFFVTWAATGGKSYIDWYLDRKGYINKNNLKN